MAELYLGRAHGIHGFEKLVVLKLVLPYLAEDRDFVEMFLHEARLAATLDHPNIVHVTDIGEVGGEPFFVMEYVHGQDVRAIMRASMRADKPLPLACALTIVMGVASGLHYVHERRGSDGRFLGLVHRDVSPANVVVSYDGGVKLVDFGIAKATEQHQSTRSGVLKGKVNYMAPEQCHGVAVDRRTDVFALGILLYETTTGRRLFAGDSDFYVMSRIVRGLFARPSEVDPDYPPELEAIILRALSTDPADRHATAQELLADIEGFAHDHRLRLSGLGVAEYLRDLFGDHPHPGSGDADDLPTMIHPDAPGSAPREAQLGGVRPTAVSPSPELTTSVMESTSSGAIEVVDPTRPGFAEHSPTRVRDSGDAESPDLVPPSAPTRRVEINMAGAQAPIPKTEPTPRVIVPLSPAVRTEPSPLVIAPSILPRSAARRTRRTLGLAVGLSLAALVAFAIGMSAGSHRRNASMPEQTAVSAPHSDPTPDPLPVAAPDPVQTPSVVHEPPPPALAPEDTERSAPSASEASPTRAQNKTNKSTSKSTPSKKRRSSDTPRETKPSALDAMYPSTSQTRDRR